jgi:glutamate-ammonia-ligase adenylyltransferase
LTARQEGIFHIDLRLRPFGRGGSLASSFDAFENYFSSRGAAEQFERMALVKLRPIAGDAKLAEKTVHVRNAFVYSGQPLDYENILHLRSRQATELVPANAISAKHSRGGLVDVEYFVQAKQIDAGVCDPGVRVTNTLEAIDRLENAGHLDKGRKDKLSATYGFLRRLIDALRAVRGNARDLTLPAVESREFAYLARRLGYESAPRFQRDIEQRMGFADSLWDEVSFVKSGSRS